MVSNNKLNKTKLKLYGMNKSSFEDIANLSPSIFYYLSRLLNKKIGNNWDYYGIYIFKKSKLMQQ